MSGLPWWVSLILAWLPFLVLVGTCLWMIATLRAAFHTRDGRSFAQVIDDHTREMRRTTDLIRETVATQRALTK
jgi:hypothetical protein